MKTGFTCPAGYNLVASATHGGQKLIAVVLGAPSASARTAKTASLLDRAFQTGSGMGSLESLPSYGPGGNAPDMRDSVCRHRAKANQEFLAEVEDMTIPITAAPTGNPVLDALAGGQQNVSVKDLARLPRPQFEPVTVYVGRAPGYQGPVARARPAGVPIGAEPDLTAYSGEKSEGAGASPILHPAPDAKPLRSSGKVKKAKLATAPEPEAATAKEPAPDAQAKKASAGKSHLTRSASAKGKAPPKAAGVATAHNGKRPTKSQPANAVSAKASPAKVHTAKSKAKADDAQ